MGYSKITLKDEQVCDYLYLTNTAPEDGMISSVDSEPTTWDNHTMMLAQFNGSLVAGNSELEESIEGYEIRRRKGAEKHTEHVAEIPKSKKFIIDYLTANNTSYTYYLYPTSKSNIFPPIMSKEIQTNYRGWSLMIVDESTDENVFYLSKMFKFELNLNIGEMNNNASTSVHQNFTKFPTIQHSTSNYWSGSLTSLCGFISCVDNKYIQTINMIDELKSITSDTRRKFLKDLEGHIWEVDITSAISLTNDNSIIEDIKTISLSWAEVGKVQDVSIINNPNNPTVSWLLTVSGEASPFIDYVWDDNNVWDDSLKWTEKDDLLTIEKSNLGRDMYTTESEVV